jgi:hypothetical protein
VDEEENVVVEQFEIDKMMNSSSASYTSLTSNLRCTMSTATTDVQLEDLSPREAEATEEATDSPPPSEQTSLDKRALFSLLAQHSSS